MSPDDRPGKRWRGPMAKPLTPKQRALLDRLALVLRESPRLTARTLTELARLSGQHNPEGS